MQKISMPEFKLRMWSLGYMAFRLTPTKWRIRGEYNAIDVWPLTNQFKRSEYSVAERTEDLEATILSLVTPWPPLSPERENAQVLHRAALDTLVESISPAPTLASVM